MRLIHKNDKNGNQITAYGRRCERCIPSYSEESQKDEERANSGWIWGIFVPG